MNKKSLLMTAAFLAAFSAFQAEAGLYIGAGLGFTANTGDAKDILTNKDFDYKKSPMYSLSVGYDVPLLPVRVEGEILRNTAQLKHLDKDVHLTGAMANAYVNLPFPIVHPYVGAGVGYVRFRGENTAAYQGMFGAEASIPFFPLKGGVEYRYITTSKDAKMNKGSYKLDYNAHVVMAKVRFEF